VVGSPGPAQDRDSPPSLRTTDRGADGRLPAGLRPRPDRRADRPSSSEARPWTRANSSVVRPRTSSGSSPGRRLGGPRRQRSQRGAGGRLLPPVPAASREPCRTSGRRDCGSAGRCPGTPRPRRRVRTGSSVTGTASVLPAGSRTRPVQGAQQSRLVPDRL
jgi:hypothetical protein